MKIFGVSVATILLVIAAVAVGRTYGSKIPGINSLSVG